MQRFEFGIPSGGARPAVIFASAAAPPPRPPPENIKHRINMRGHNPNRKLPSGGKNLLLFQSATTACLVLLTTFPLPAWGNACHSWWLQSYQPQPWLTWATCVESQYPNLDFTLPGIEEDLYMDCFCEFPDLKTQWRDMYATVPNWDQSSGRVDCCQYSSWSSFCDMDCSPNCNDARTQECREKCSPLCLEDMYREQQIALGLSKCECEDCWDKIKCLHDHAQNTTHANFKRVCDTEGFERSNEVADWFSCAQRYPHSTVWEQAQARAHCICETNVHAASVRHHCCDVPGHRHLCFENELCGSRDTMCQTPAAQECLHDCANLCSHISETSNECKAKCLDPGSLCEKYQKCEPQGVKNHGYICDDGITMPDLGGCCVRHDASFSTEGNKWCPRFCANDEVWWVRATDRYECSCGSCPSDQQALTATFQTLVAEHVEQKYRKGLNRILQRLQLASNADHVEALEHLFRVMVDNCKQNTRYEPGRAISDLPMELQTQISVDLDSLEKEALALFTGSGDPPSIDGAWVVSDAEWTRRGNIIANTRTTTTPAPAGAGGNGGDGATSSSDESRTGSGGTTATGGTAADGTTTSGGTSSTTPSNANPNVANTGNRDQTQNPADWTASAGTPDQETGGPIIIASEDDDGLIPPSGGTTSTGGGGDNSNSGGPQDDTTIRTPENTVRLVGRTQIRMALPITASGTSLLRDQAFVAAFQTAFAKQYQVETSKVRINSFQVRSVAIATNNAGAFRRRGEEEETEARGDRDHRFQEKIGIAVLDLLHRDRHLVADEEATRQKALMVVSTSRRPAAIETNPADSAAKRGVQLARRAGVGRVPTEIVPGEDHERVESRSPGRRGPEEYDHDLRLRPIKLLAAGVEVVASSSKKKRFNKFLRTLSSMTGSKISNKVGYDSDMLMRAQSHDVLEIDMPHRNLLPKQVVRKLQARKVASPSQTSSAGTTAAGTTTRQLTSSSTTVRTADRYLTTGHEITLMRAPDPQDTLKRMQDTLARATTDTEVLQNALHEELADRPNYVVKNVEGVFVLDCETAVANGRCRIDIDVAQSCVAECRRGAVPVYEIVRLDNDPNTQRANNETARVILTAVGLGALVFGLVVFIGRMRGRNKSSVRDGTQHYDENNPLHQQQHFSTYYHDSTNYPNRAGRNSYYQPGSGAIVGRPVLGGASNGVTSNRHIPTGMIMDASEVPTAWGIGESSAANRSTKTPAQLATGGGNNHNPNEETTTTSATLDSTTSGATSGTSGAINVDSVDLNSVRSNSSSNKVSPEQQSEAEGLKKAVDESFARLPPRPGMPMPGTTSSTLPGASASNTNTRVTTPEEQTTRGGGSSSSSCSTSQNASATAPPTTTPPPPDQDAASVSAAAEDGVLSINKRKATFYLSSQGSTRVRYNATSLVSTSGGPVVGAVVVEDEYQPSAYVDDDGNLHIVDRHVPPAPVLTGTSAAGGASSSSTTSAFLPSGSKMNLFDTGTTSKQANAGAEVELQQGSSTTTKQHIREVLQEVRASVPATTRESYRQGGTTASSAFSSKAAVSAGENNSLGGPANGTSSTSTGPGPKRIPSKDTTKAGAPTATVTPTTSSSSGTTVNASTTVAGAGEHTTSTTRSLRPSVDNLRRIGEPLSTTANSASASATTTSSSTSATASIVQQLPPAATGGAAAAAPGGKKTGSK
ncbi:unnamed protein product [Amoebophrya sp. A120]|nr:unnamed protein product [Amoebophrya sp. A120]|eukprot:GSA120T00004264001.1